MADEILTLIELKKYEPLYWRLVRHTLKEVFDAPGSLVDDYEQSLKAAPPMERLLACHDSPLDLAAALTGSEVTQARRDRYQQVLAAEQEQRERHGFSFLQNAD